jgi:hypothetical protein
MRSTSTFFTTANLPAVLLSHPQGAPHREFPQFAQFPLLPLTTMPPEHISPAPNRPGGCAPWQRQPAPNASGTCPLAIRDRINDA